MSKTVENGVNVFYFDPIPTNTTDALVKFTEEVLTTMRHIGHPAYSTFPVEMAEIEESITREKEQIWWVTKNSPVTAHLVGLGFGLGDGQTPMMEVCTELYAAKSKSKYPRGLGLILHLIGIF